MQSHYSVKPDYWCLISLMQFFTFLLYCWAKSHESPRAAQQERSLAIFMLMHFLFTHSSPHYTVFVSGLCSVYKYNIKALGHGTSCLTRIDAHCCVREESERNKIKDCVSWLVKMELVMSVLSLWIQNGRRTGGGTCSGRERTYYSLSIFFIPF